MTAHTQILLNRRLSTLVAIPDPSLHAAESPAMAFRSWDDADLDRQSCIGLELSEVSIIKGMSTFKPAGQLLARWDDEIRKTAVTILRHPDNRSRVQSNGHAYSLDLFMLSPSGRDGCRPFLVCSSRKKRISKAVIRIVENHQDFMGFGFSYHAHGDFLILTNSGSQVRPSNINEMRDDSQSLCGRSILACSVPVNQAHHFRRATVGGTLKLGKVGHEKYYGLIPAHTFINDVNWGEESDEESEDSSDGSGESAVTKRTLSQASRVPSHTSDNPPQPPCLHYIFLTPKDGEVSTEHSRLLNVSQDIAIGDAFHGYHLPDYDHDKFYNPRLDWALFEVTNSRFWGCNEYELLNSSTIVRPRFEYGVVNPPDGDLVVLNSARSIETRGLGVKSSIHLPWSDDFVEGWLILGEMGMFL
jgi:hypothetical protein